MEDPAHPNYPQELLATVGPRNMVHSWATTTDDPTVMPRRGKIGKQRIEDAGTLTGAAADMILRPHDKDAVALTPDPQAVPRQDRLASRGGEHALRYLAGF
jgi:hypothetical protein